MGDIPDDAQAVSVLVAATGNGSVQVTVANGRPTETPAGAWSDCGTARITHEANPYVGVVWSEARGRSATAAVAGQSIVLDALGGQETFALGLDLELTYTIDIDEPAVFEVRLGVGRGEVFEPSVTLTGADVLLQETERRPEDFACGARLSEANATGVAVGVVPVTAIRSLQETIPVRDPVAAVAYAVPDPRYPGACDLRMYARGTELARDDNADPWCGVSASNVTGEVEIHLEHSAGVGVVTGYSAWG